MVIPELCFVAAVRRSGCERFSHRLGFSNGEVDQKDANPLGPQVAGSIFPFSNRVSKVLFF